MPSPFRRVPPLDYPSARGRRPCGVRLMFCLYLALIAAGLAFYIVVGLTHH
jgi:hypothetical protein